MTRASHSAMLLLAAGLALPVVPDALVAQTLRGRVLEAGTDRPVPRAVVRLLDDVRQPVALALSDSTGFYLVTLPAPGRYALSVEAFGFAPFESDLILVADTGLHLVDLEVEPAPLEIAGLEVSAERRSEIEQGLKLVLGVSGTGVLRTPPILRDRIQWHVDRGHGLVDLVRREGPPSLTVRHTSDGVCIQLRGRGCLPAYLNGMRVPRGMADGLPLDLAEVVVVLHAGESPQYAAGAVLLYTRGWVNP